MYEAQSTNGEWCERERGEKKERRTLLDGRDRDEARPSTGRPARAGVAKVCPSFSDAQGI